MTPAEAELTIYNTPDLFLIGHGAADGAETAGTVGQVPAAAAAAGISQSLTCIMYAPEHLYVVNYTKPKMHVLWVWLHTEIACSFVFDSVAVRCKCQSSGRSV